MKATITLRFDGICRDCGAALKAGTRARWYGKGRVYCAGQHEGASAKPERELTFKERYGRCEDAPCCGCCGIDAYGNDNTY
jgi:hypothetical protein